MSRIHLVVLALSFSIGCSNPLDVQVSFTRLVCKTRSSCEATLQQFIASHRDEGVIALDYQTRPEPSLVITHGTFGEPMRDLRISAAHCSSKTACWDTLAARYVSARW